MPPLYEGYGVAGSKKSTSPNSSSPPPTTTGSRPTASPARASSLSPSGNPYYYGGTPTATNYELPPLSPSELKILGRARGQISRATGTDMGTVIENVTDPNQGRAVLDTIRSGGTLPSYLRPKPKTTTPPPTNTPPAPDWTQLPALTPEQQMAFRQGMRGTERDFEALMNQVRLGRRTARRDFRQGVRQVNRQQAGGSQDLATALAYLGMDTSPATMGVGLQDIERQADLERAQLAAQKADELAALEARVVEGQIARNRSQAQLRMDRANARAAAATNLERYMRGNV